MQNMQCSKFCRDWGVLDTFACWWGLLRISMFLILDYLFCFFYYLPFYECWSAQLLFINITGTTSVWDYQCMSSACRLYWCLILQMAASAPLYSTSSPQEVNIHMLLCYISNYHRSLQYCLSLLTRSYTLISDPPLLTSCDPVSVLCMFFTLYKT